MKGKKTFCTSMIVTLIVSMVMLGGGSIVSASPADSSILINPTPKVLVDPSLNDQFNVTVEAFNVTDYYGADFWLFWNRTLLNITAVTDHGPNTIVDNLTLTDPQHSYSVNMNNTYNATHGRLTFSDTFVSAEGAPKFTGSGVIGIVTFMVTYVPPEKPTGKPPDYQEANCTLEFDPEWTAMFNLVDTTPGEITKDIYDGFYSVKTTNPTPGAPTANFDYSPKIPFVCDTVNLWDTSDPGPTGATIEIYEWTITGDVDNIGPLDQAQTYFHCNGSGTVTVTLNVTNNFDLSDDETKQIEQKEVVGCLLDVYTSTNRFCGQVTPHVGKGINETCDALSPDVNITLFAEVTWNNAPVNHVLVAFEVIWDYYVDWQDPVKQDPQYWEEKNECVLYRTAETDKDGIARIWFRVPTPCDQQMFGKWHVVATAKIQEVKQEDWMAFDVGHLITLVSVETELTAYPRCCSDITFTIVGKNIAQINKTVTFIVTVYDDCDVPIGQKIAVIDILAGRYCSPTHFTIILYDAIHVPQWAYVGIGKVYVSAFTAIPSECGVPYCPEKSNVFEITYEGPCP